MAMSALRKVLVVAAFVCLLAAAAIGWSPLRDSLLGDDSPCLEEDWTVEQKACWSWCLLKPAATPTVDEELSDLGQCLVVARAKGYDVSSLADAFIEQVEERNPETVHFWLETCQQILR
jgi:hypothetical protein